MESPFDFKRVSDNNPAEIAQALQLLGHPTILFYNDEYVLQQLKAPLTED